MSRPARHTISRCSTFIGRRIVDLFDSPPVAVAVEAAVFGEKAAWVLNDELYATNLIRIVHAVYDRRPRHERHLPVLLSDRRLPVVGTTKLKQPFIPSITTHA